MIPPTPPIDGGFGGIIGLSGIDDISNVGPPIFTGGRGGKIGGIAGSSSGMLLSLPIDKKSSLGNLSNGSLGFSTGKGAIGKTGACGSIGIFSIGFIGGAIGSIRATGSLDKFCNNPLFLNALLKNPIFNLPFLDSLQTSSSSCRCF